MEKSIKYLFTKFSQEVIQLCLEKMDLFAKEEGKKGISNYLTITYGNESWRHDNEAEFFTDYFRDVDYAHFSRRYYDGTYKLNLTFNNSSSIVEIVAPHRSEIEELHQVFLKNSEKCLLPQKMRINEEETIIFLGHGKSSLWRELKDHLQDKHNYKIEAYEVGARAGHTIRDILEEMLGKSSIAFIVMTAEDKDSDGVFHARENVIHELGLFQGKLGFHKAIAIVEEGTHEFSNINGIQQLRFTKGNIKEIFGDVIATLKRESD